MSIRASWLTTTLAEKKVQKDVAVALYYKEAVAGSVVEIPQKTFEESEILVFAASATLKQVSRSKEEIPIHMKPDPKKVMKPTMFATPE